MIKQVNRAARWRRRVTELPASAVCAAVSALGVEAFVVRTAVNRSAAVRMMRPGVLLLLLVEVGVGVNRSSYT